MLNVCAIGKTVLEAQQRNLLAHPDTQVQIGREVRRVRARTATPEERAALWPRLVEVYADFANYQRWTEREIPVVVCEPR